ncbi:hypothetical protein PPL_10033 [Heterostelium album PN500]|uniref:CBS domain-containing protein n=1 Tax=Heterostelium pallidum (strain ATCC 26659 / Pp 5 / PN500) TaxID=670386 RepID=D3BQ52_HETP5|nr:hypothetical protein PPL_10033 [Heterostelium album PN500]EFA76272.1 hypothetical protein PPL_10033 [Heterostelium album PN500]|eukprot:XP_020428404.1 hypothetical protein PPL_10033 [Heterostelium album PN500]
MKSSIIFRNIKYGQPSNLTPKGSILKPILLNPSTPKTRLFINESNEKSIIDKRYMINISRNIEVLNFKELTPEAKERRHTAGFVDTKVMELLSNKPRGYQNIIKVKEGDTVFNAIQTMQKHKVGALVVVDAENRMTGIFSERDYMNRIVVKDLSSRTTYIKDVMSPHVVTVRTDTSTAKCMSIMIKRGFRHLPVVEGEKLVGILSIGDLVKHIISDQRSEINHLKQRLGGSYPDDLDQGL